MTEWERHLPLSGAVRALEVGSRHGGISLFLAQRGYQVTCSDRGGPTPRARALHARYGVEGRIDYQDLDVTALQCPDSTYEVVCFKSVLGGLVTNVTFEHQAQAVRELHRVLRPGGILAFAENLAASPLHLWARRRFVGWGPSWRYVQYDELEALFLPFARIELDTTGFLAAFGRSEPQRKWLHWIDRAIVPIVPRRLRYVAFGCAFK